MSLGCETEQHYAWTATVHPTTVLGREPWHLRSPCRGSPRREVLLQGMHSHALDEERVCGCQMQNHAERRAASMLGASEAVVPYTQLP